MIRRVFGEKMHAEKADLWRPRRFLPLINTLLKETAELETPRTATES